MKPDLQRLFESLCDAGADLVAKKVSPDGHRVTVAYRANDAFPSRHRTRTFELRVPRHRSGRPTPWEWDFRYVEVRARGDAPAWVSRDVASAVMAVALR